MKINLESSKDSDENQRMNSKIDNIEIMIGNNADKMVNEISSFTTQKEQNREQIDLENPKKMVVLSLIILMEINIIIR